MQNLTSTADSTTNFTGFVIFQRSLKNVTALKQLCRKAVKILLHKMQTKNLAVTKTRLSVSGHAQHCVLSAGSPTHFLGQ